MKNGFSLIEIILISVIISIMASFAVPQYVKIQEKSLDNEAKATLVMIQAAQNIYKSESNSFIAALGATAHADLNSNLGLSLPDPATKWNFTAKVTLLPAPEKVCIQAKRNGSDSREWRIWDTDDAPVALACP